MAPTTIARLTKLSAPEGVFGPNSIDVDAPDFRRFNLVYGFNGSGKTSLTRALSGLGNGRTHAGLPPGLTIEAQLSDGSKASSAGDSEALKGRILIFNSDFIEENISWKEGVAKPVFYLGKKQAGLGKQLDQATRRVSELGAQLKAKNADLKQRRREFAEFKRTRAFRLESELNKTRGYRAPDLEKDLLEERFSQRDRLTEEQRKKDRATLVREAALPKRPMLTVPPHRLIELISEVGALVEKNVEDVARAVLGEHVALVDWIKRGVDYHREKSIDTCLFCGSQLTMARLDVLASAIGQRYEQLLGEVESLRQLLEPMREQLRGEIISLPSENDLDAAVRERGGGQLDELRSALEDAERLAEAGVRLLVEKREHPGSRVDSRALRSPNKPSAVWARVQSAVDAINTSLREHNTIAENFEALRGEAASRLKRSCLAEVQDEFRDLKFSLEARESELRKVQAERLQVEGIVEDLSRQLREHGPAAEAMTALLEAYLGHDELRVGVLDEGYQLLRNGRAVSGPLSEGEKTALALCYFFVSIEAGGRRVRDLIIVVDDPISSLDTRSLNYVFTLIRSRLQRAAQLFLLTHNVTFMNSVKKWLKPYVSGDEPKASLLFLDVRRPVDREARSTTLREMPKHIREYESEYQYLFHLLLGFVEGTTGSDYFYAVPNALRRALEVFFAFRFPGSSGFESQLELASKEAAGLDQSRLGALGRLAQVASHGDNIDALVEFPAMTLEEASDAAQAWVQLLKALDQKHYDRMCRICR